MDTFVEQIIVKKKDGRQIVAITAVVLLSLLLFALIILYIGYLYILAPLLICGLGYGAWWLISMQNLEYEYSITNGDIDIDQIIARRKRKRVVSVSGQKIESAGTYRPEEWQGRLVDRLVMAAPSPTADGVCYFTYHSKKRGNTLVLFQPDERVNEAFRKLLSRPVQLDWERR